MKYEPAPLLSDIGNFRTTDFFLAAFIFYRTGNPPEIFKTSDPRKKIIEFCIEKKKGREYEKEYLAIDTLITLTEYLDRLNEIKNLMKASDYQIVDPWNK